MRACVRALFVRLYRHVCMNGFRLISAKTLPNTMKALSTHVYLYSTSDLLLLVLPSEKCLEVQHPACSLERAYRTPTCPYVKVKA